MNKKKLFVIATVVSMIAILSFSTLAWFSDADSVTNNFQVDFEDKDNDGEVSADEIFSVDVMEAVDANDDGKFDWTGATGDKTVGLKGDASSDGTFTYERILPGDMLFKRPSTKNTGSYKQYLRMKVTFNNAHELLHMLANYNLTPLDMLYNAEGSLYSDALYTNTKYLLKADAKWSWDNVTEIDANADTVTYTFYYNGILEPDQSAVLFSWVNIPCQLTENDMALFENGAFQMVITGEAVQTENLGDGVDTAQEAFAVVTQTQEIKTN